MGDRSLLKKNGAQVGGLDGRVVAKGAARFQHSGQAADNRIIKTIPLTGLFSSKKY